jgi:predicted metal-dependent hydrolase
VKTSHIQFGLKQIDFSFRYTERKSLGITVTPELKIVVHAPFGTPIEKIKVRVKKKASWIIKQQNFFLSFHPKTPARKYVSGETHLYLGRQYMLKVIIGKENIVRYKGRFVEVTTKNKNKVGELLNLWYRQRAKDKFSSIAEPIILRFKRYNVEPSALYIQEMRTRWGSCTPKGKIILNPELIKAPKPCIEYVIIHELCHLVYPNHTNKFLALQNKQMPDWEKWKMRLERLMV